MNSLFRVWPLWLALLPLAVHAEAGKRADPVDPSALVPPPKYESAFSDYRPFKEQTVGPWNQVLEEVSGVPGAATQSGHGGQAMAGDLSGMAQDKPGTKQDRSAMTAPKGDAPSAAPDPRAGRDVALQTATNASGDSDTKGVVKSINRADGKLTLKHGPIAKFDMPGMTMVFRVNDPKLLDQVKEGDEIGVTVERIGGALVITGIQK